jgi:hypothetical protein
MAIHGHNLMVVYLLVCLINVSATEQIFFYRSTACLKQEGHQREKSTVDEDEVRHFNELSRIWWDEKEARALHQMNKLR